MTKKELVSNFVLSMEQYRLENEWTQAQMAENLELSVSGYKKIISGETKRIDMLVAYNLHMLTGQLLSELCGDNSPELSIHQKIRKLTKEQRDHLEHMIDSQLAVQAKAEPEDDCVTLYVPTANITEKIMGIRLILKK